MVIDWGASQEGYFSDITRTLCMGEPPQQAREIHKVTLEANRAAQLKAAPGIQARQVDEAARQVITTAGYGEYFTHRTGHGFGRKAHEDPFISSTETTRLAPGMTFTIEPGIYIPGWGGVRIEDDMLMQADGAETLTSLPRELFVIPTDI